MTDRREPTISSLPPEQDEPSRTRSRPAHSGSSGGAGGGGGGGRSNPPPVASRPVVVRSPLGPLALLIALLAVGGSGYLYWLLLEAQDALAQSRDQMQQTQERVLSLESRLESSDDESTQSLTALQVRVRENESEIRKLWGVANDRNRKAIAALEESVNQLTTRLAAAEGVKATLQGMTGEVAVLTELVGAQQSAISGATQASQQQGQTLQSLLQRLDELEGRVGNNEEAITAIDAFRVQVNRQLLQGG